MVFRRITVQLEPFRHWVYVGGEVFEIVDFSLHRAAFVDGLTIVNT